MSSGRYSINDVADNMPNYMNAVRPIVEGSGLAHCCFLMLVCVSQMGCVILHGDGENDLIQTSIVSTKADAKSERAFQAGLKHYQAGRIDSAMESFHKSIQINPTHGRSMNNLGLIYFQRHQLAKAATQFDSAIQFLPEDPTPLNNLGMTLEAGGRTDEAIELYRQASLIDPENPKYLGNLVRLQIRMGDESEMVRQQLLQLAMIEDRAEWIQWVQEKLSLDMNPLLDRGGEISDLNQEIKATISSSDSANRVELVELNAPASSREIPKTLPSSDASLQAIPQEIVLPNPDQPALETSRPIFDAFPNPVIIAPLKSQ